MVSKFLFYSEGAVVFLIILMILVAAHEFGHYIFARLFGMGAEEFSIGMLGKKPLVTWLRRTYRIRVKPGQDPYKRSQGFGMSFESGSGAPAPDPVVIDTPEGPELEETTVFTVRPWPIGGFVRIKGMMPEEDGSEVSIPGGFYSKPPWQRLIVLFAGPLFSVLAGVLTYMILFAYYGINKQSSDPVIGGVVEGSAADKAGIREGDRILAINGKPVTSFYGVRTAVQDSPNVRFQFTYSEQGKTKQTTVIPVLEDQASPVFGPDWEPTGEVKKQAKIGILPIFTAQKISIGAAFVEAWRQPLDQIKGLESIVVHPATVKDSLSGPGTMFKMTASAVQDGIEATIATAALISIAVGIMNLLPVFPLDGGQIVVALAEMLRGGRRLSIQFQNLIGTVGLATLFLIVATGLFFDVGRWTQNDKPLKIVHKNDKASAPAAPAKGR